MNECLNWLFGRGASVACGLGWTVPDEWNNYTRGTLVEKIKNKTRLSTKPK